jgi:hypothetical protein
MRNEATPPAAQQEPIAQDVQEKCRIEAVPAKGGLLPAAPVQPLHGEATTYAERFTHAVAVLCGAQPPADMVAEWIANVDVNGEHRLQGWVLSQAATPSWAQGIVVLDAAHVLANDPEEGAGHKDRPPAAPTVQEPVVLTDELEALFTNIDHAISSGAWNVQKGSQTWEVIEEAKAAHGITKGRP